MTIRPATLADVPRLLHLAMLEHARSQFKGEKFEAAVAQSHLEHAIAGMLSRVLVSDAGLGYIAGILQPRIFNRAWVAYELAWYAEDGSGMALLNAFCDWARKMRAVSVVVSNYAGINEPAKFTRVMKRGGFDLLGSSYCKSL